MLNFARSPERIKVKREDNKRLIAYYEFRAEFLDRDGLQLLVIKLTQHCMKETRYYDGKWF